MVLVDPSLTGLLQLLGIPHTVSTDAPDADEAGGGMEQRRAATNEANAERNSADDALVARRDKTAQAYAQGNSQPYVDLDRGMDAADSAVISHSPNPVQDSVDAVGYRQQMLNQRAANRQSAQAPNLSPVMKTMGQLMARGALSPEAASFVARKLYAPALNHPVVQAYARQQYPANVIPQAQAANSMMQMLLAPGGFSPLPDSVSGRRGNKD